MDAELAVDGAMAWLRLLLGVLVFLAPGLALADRVFENKLYLVLAPVFSFSALPLAAILLDFAFGVPINAWSTTAIALTVATWAGWPRIRRLGTRLTRGAPHAG